MRATWAALIAFTAFGTLGSSAPLWAQEDEPPATEDEVTEEESGAESTLEDVTSGEETPAPEVDDGVDHARLKQLAEEAATGEWGVQRAALAELAGSGGHAVQPLLRWVASRATVDARIKGVYALRRLGSGAVPALVAALHSGDAMVRRNVCMALADAGDARAVPALIAVVERDADPLAQEQAKLALAKLGAAGASGAPAALAALSARYLAKDATVFPSPAPAAVFFWNGSKVASRRVTPDLAAAASAKIAAEHALALDPSHAGAREALVAAYRGLAAGVAALAEASGDDLPDEGTLAVWNGHLAKLDDLVRLGGSAAAGDAEAEAAPETPAAAPFAGAAELLGAGDKRLRYKSALSLARNGAPATVVLALADALSESAVRQVLVIDDNGDELNHLVGMLQSGDVFAVGAKSGALGLVRAKEQPAKDAILIRSSVRDVPPDQLISSLRRDVRTKDVPAIVIAEEKDVERVRELLGDSVVAVVPAPVNRALLQPSLAAAFEAAALNDQRMEAEGFSHQAAAALAALDAGTLAPAEPALVGAIGREDAVRIPALRALGTLGAKSAEAGAVKLLGDASASTDARVAAGLALRSILAQHDAAPGTIDALKLALASDDAAVRSAAAKALGQAKSLGAADRAALLLSNSLAF